MIIVLQGEMAVVFVGCFSGFDNRHNGGGGDVRVIRRSARRRESEAARYKSSRAHNELRSRWDTGKGDEMARAECEVTVERSVCASLSEGRCCLLHAGGSPSFQAQCDQQQCSRPSNRTPYSANNFFPFISLLSLQQRSITAAQLVDSVSGVRG